MLNALAAVAVGLEVGSVRAHRRRARSSRAPSGASSGAARARRHGGRRLRAPSDRDRRGLAAARPASIGAWSWCSSRTATPGRATDARVRTALDAADEVVLTDIYAAGEPPIPGVTLDALATGRPRAAPGRCASSRRSTRRRQRWRLARREIWSSRWAPDPSGDGDRILEAIRAAPHGRQPEDAREVKAGREANFRARRSSRPDAARCARASWRPSRARHVVVIALAAIAGGSLVLTRCRCSTSAVDVHGNGGSRAASSRRSCAISKGRTS